jgi:hypothetical protein
MLLIRNIKPYLSVSTLKIIYHSLFHSVLSYGVRFWGNSSHSSVIFKMQKRVISIIMGCSYREFCTELFKELNTLTLSSQYMFSLLLFVVNNRDYFVSNNVYHDINNSKKLIYTCLRYLWPCIGRDFIIRAVRLLTSSQGH